MDRRKFIKNSLGLLGACAFPSTAFGSSDFYIDDKSLFDSTFSKLKAVQSHIGFGYFNIISFDEVLKIARNSKIGAFNTAQINFMDFMFSEDPKKYGFYGRKTCDRLTSAINKKISLKYLEQVIIYLKDCLMMYILDLLKMLEIRYFSQAA
ncbi:TPA: hypothetical protein RPW09_000441 [Campylobacter fetus subsp. venerealis]|nr:hypothetical protein [Campylobacter fetus subsp. venerealis]HDX6242123.1 hypothetical protein [Campylobacter fetus subsp. venerealis]HDX6243149.1 hypothetical protein [Campylobacter fetus subsp. venerealis]HDX6245628.1 hypothetical protein [Campylobacter fetus subsp. venerealis]HDX6249072.1 hypothetical protein [Campylobacter fetus subsp. venerealis]